MYLGSKINHIDISYFARHRIHSQFVKYRHLGHDYVLHLILTLRDGVVETIYLGYAREKQQKSKMMSGYPGFYVDGRMN